MKITRISQLSGISHTMEIAVTQEQLDRWQNTRTSIKDIMPNLTPDEREFIMTGITSEEWTEAFPPEDEDEDEDGD